MTSKYFSPYQYILIDIANAYGLDKITFEERIEWTTSNIDALESYIKQADEPVLFTKAVQALKLIHKGQPTAHMMGLDACSSGMQIMGAVMGCQTTCLNTGLIDPNVRADVYAKVVEYMHALGVDAEYDRKLVKPAVMTHYYGSKAEPVKVFGDGTPELKAFYKANAKIAPGANDLMQVMLELVDPDATEYCWTLPDGFEVRATVIDKVHHKVQIEELGGKTFTHVIRHNRPKEKDVSLAANIVHSIDGFMVREIGARTNYDEIPMMIAHSYLSNRLENEPNLKPANEFTVMTVNQVIEADIEEMSIEWCKQAYKLVEQVIQFKPVDVVTVHDEYKSRPSGMNALRFHYKSLLAQFASSHLIADILNQITGTNNFNIDITEGLSDKIMQSNYALS